MVHDPTHVLLVDDDPKLLCSLERHLSDAGFVVTKAISAAEALVVLNRVDIDVVLCDNQMTGSSGTKLLSTISKQYPDTLRFMLTGRISQSQSWLIQNEIKVCRLFTKPCAPAEIIAEIRRAELTSPR